jgi:probable rRNA maturation factor
MAGKDQSRTVTIQSHQRHLRVPRRRLESLVAFVGTAEKAPFDEVDILVVDDTAMERYNRQFLNHTGTTDVITFDLSDAAGQAVEIIVSGQLARRVAADHDHGPQRELTLYVLHGLLHAVGYDDQTPADREAMHARQEQLLEAFWPRR